MYQRAAPVIRNSAPTSSRSPPPLLPQKAQALESAKAPQSDPRIFGLPLKYVSLVTLAVQNAALSIVMHYSRVFTPPQLAYSPASAVLLNELLKGGLSFVIALARTPPVNEIPWSQLTFLEIILNLPWPWTQPFFTLCSEILSPDAWKLSIPAILYVIQNSLQFVAISNLPVASFQVTYQMKILTTAAFSVAMLRKRISRTKWLALFFLAIGVGIVQIQTAGDVGGHHKEQVVGSAHDSAPLYTHVMSPLKGFGAVTAACFTSGLAGVYFEMVLKNSKADLWVRNVQLSLFSLIPALLPILYAPTPKDSEGFVSDVFRNFGFWAWAVVSIQVFGGLITAIVIKYSDNILKGFATSLSIILSFLASVVLFDFKITYSFLVGASTVLTATALYNQPDQPAGTQRPSIITLPKLSEEKVRQPFPGTPVSPNAPILGGELPTGLRTKPPTHYDGLKKTLGRLTPSGSTESLRALVSGASSKNSTPQNSPPQSHLYPGYVNPGLGFGSALSSPYPSRPPSRNSTTGSVGRISREPSSGDSQPPSPKDFHQR
ncbi:nucleotide-sugar transporter-domain-containing protein [Flagelloscypha sp. PMI_526]|nr:nucleotide-sugar transporter-domain-containing protein [Flagelloscypha sp. PMI_526]